MSVFVSLPPSSIPSLPQLPFSPWPLHWHPSSFTHAQLNTHTYTHAHSLSSSSASVIRLLSSPVIGISCERSSPRWQHHKASDRCLWMRPIREKMASLLPLLTRPTFVSLPSFCSLRWLTLGLLTPVAKRPRCHTIFKSYTVYLSRCCLPLSSIISLFRQ